MLFYCISNVIVWLNIESRLFRIVALLTIKGMGKRPSACCVCVCVCVRVCVRACERTCVRACARSCVI